MSWKSASVAHKNAPQGIFFKLADGAKTDVIFVGEPLEVTEEFDGKGALRFQFNVYRVAENVMQVWSISPRVFARLLSIHDENMVAGHVIRVKRRGVGKETDYDLFVQGKASKAQVAASKAIDQHDLPVGNADSAEAPDHADDDDAPAAAPDAPASKAGKAGKASKPADDDFDDLPPFHDDADSFADDPAVAALHTAATVDALKAAFAAAWRANTNSDDRKALKAAYDQRMAQIQAGDGDIPF